MSTTISFEYEYEVSAGRYVSIPVERMFSGLLDKKQSISIINDLFISIAKRHHLKDDEISFTPPIVTHHVLRDQNDIFGNIRNNDSNPFSLENHKIFKHYVIPYENEKNGECHKEIIKKLYNKLPKYKKREITDLDYFLNNNTNDVLLEFLTKYEIYCVLNRSIDNDDYEILYSNLHATNKKNQNTYILTTNGHLYLLKSRKFDEKLIGKGSKDKKNQVLCDNIYDKFKELILDRIIPTDVCGKISSNTIDLFSFKHDDMTYLNATKSLDKSIRAQELLGLDKIDKSIPLMSLTSKICRLRGRSFNKNFMSDFRGNITYTNKNCLKNGLYYEFDIEKCYLNIISKMSHFNIFNEMQHNVIEYENKISSNDNFYFTKGNNVEYKIEVNEPNIFIRCGWYSAEYIEFLFSSNFNFLIVAERKITRKNLDELKLNCQKIYDIVRKLTDKQDISLIKNLYGNIITQHQKPDYKIVYNILKIATNNELETEQSMRIKITDEIGIKYSIERRSKYKNNMLFVNQVFDLIRMKIFDFMILNGIRMEQVSEIRTDDIKFYSEKEIKCIHGIGEFRKKL